MVVFVKLNVWNWFELLTIPAANAATLPEADTIPAPRLAIPAEAETIPAPPAATFNIVWAELDTMLAPKFTTPCEDETILAPKAPIWAEEDIAPSDEPDISAAIWADEEINAGLLVTLEYATVLTSAEPDTICPDLPIIILPDVAVSKSKPIELVVKILIFWGIIKLSVSSYTWTNTSVVPNVCEDV